MSDRPSRLFASTPKVTQSAGERMKPPSCCQFCDDQTVVAILVVREGSRVRSGAPSDFLDKGALRPEYQFVEWVTRCAGHYLRDLYRMKRGRWNGINDDGSPTLDDYRRLHGDRPSVRRGADSGEQGEQARDVGSDPEDAAGASGVLGGVEGAGRHDYRDSIRRAVAGRWDAYGDGGTMVSGAQA